MKAYLLEVLVVADDGVGAEAAAMMIEDARYPNRCIDPKCVAYRDAGLEWDDDHPLNRRDVDPAPTFASAKRVRL